MNVGKVLRPKSPRNFVLTLVGCALLLLSYAVGSSLWPWSPKRGVGLVFGILAASIFVFEMLYPFRRSRARPLSTAKNWLQAHVYLGVIAFLGVLAHAGFTWPHGVMGWSLLLLSAWTTFTGLLGVWLQKWIPSALSEGLRVEALYERIPSLVQKLLAEADTLMADASDIVERFYRSDIRNRMAAVSPSWGYVLDIRGGRERALEPFRRMSQFVDAAEKERVDDLATIYTEKMELDAQYSLQGILRRWLVFHVPPAGLLMGLLAIHIFAWLWY
jgi:hypothetical protein